MQFLMSVENISVTTKDVVNVLEHEVTSDVNEMQEASMVDGSTTSWNLITIQKPNING